MPIQVDSWKLAFSLNKQGDIATAVADANLNKLRPANSFAAVRREFPARVGDADWVSKGTPFATFVEPLQIAHVIDEQAHVCSDLEALFSLGYVMGDVASIQPDALGLPNTWEHTITWQDVEALPEVIYTTLLEEYAGGSAPGYRKKLTGAWLSQVTMSGELDNFVLLSFTGGAREYTTEATATPPASVTTASLFKTIFGTINLGAPAAPDISAKVISWNLVFNRNAEQKFRMGAAAGEEQLVTRTTVGKQQVTGSITLELEDTFRDLLLNETEAELIITLASEDQVDSNPKTIAITLPRVKFATEAFGTEGQIVTYTLNMDEQSVLKPAGEPATVVITTNIDDTEILVTSP